MALAKICFSRIVINRAKILRNWLSPFLIKRETFLYHGLGHVHRWTIVKHGFVHNRLYYQEKLSKGSKHSNKVKFLQCLIIISA